MRKILIGFALATLAGGRANAAVRAFFLPADRQAIVLLQGLSTGQADPDARKLYDALAMPATDAPGGKGKGLKTPEFIMSCVAREQMANDAICSFTVKASPRTKISSARQTAEVFFDGDDAARFYKLATGAEAGEPRAFQNADGRIRVEFAPNHFLFKYGNVQFR